jgi:hypothetical protein
MNEASSPSTELAALAQKLQQLQAIYPDGQFSGRGIVIAAGGSIMFTNAYVLVSVLRRALGCTLPIEVWHFGPAEMSPAMAELLLELDVELVDALPHIAATGIDIRDGWQLKPFCLQHSRFEEVLLIDADQVPVADPAGVFDWPEFRETGAVFWPDVVALRDDNPVWQGMGLSPQRPAISLESGQLVLDKRRHWRALSIAVGLNAAASLVYRYLYGDKDTFLIAFRLAEENFSLVPHQPFQAPRWIAQRDFSGNALFQHLTNHKWSYAADVAPPEALQLFDECQAALSILRARWNGRVFNAPDRSTTARAAEAELVAICRLRLEIVGEEQEEIELRRFGEIGKGRSGMRQNWWCEGEGNDVELLFGDAERVRYRLKRQPDGTWQGPRYTFVTAEALLAPIIDTSPIAENLPGLADELLRAVGFPNESADDWARFRTAMTLIARIDPGVVERLRTIAGSLDAAHSEALLQLLADIAPQQNKRLLAGADIEVLRKGYRRLLDLSDE